MDIVVQCRLAHRALEQEGLVGKFQRAAMVEIDFHLRRAGLMAQRVDVNLLHLAVIIDILEQRIEFVHRINAIGLARLFSTPRLTRRGDKRVVGISALLDKEEFQLRCHHRGKAGLFEQPQHPLQHGAWCEGNDLAFMVIGVMNDLRCRGIIPRHQTTTVRVGAQNDIGADFAQHLGIKILARYRLAEHIFRQAQPARPGGTGEFMDRQDLATRNAGNITDKAFDLGDRLVLQPLFHVERHATSPQVVSEPQLVSRGVQCLAGNPDSLVDIGSAIGQCR